MRIYFYYLILILYIFPIKLFGQFEYIFSFDQFSNEQGLSQSQVSDIEEDGNGRMWISTYAGGVTVFDGYRQIYFSQKDGLPGFNVTSLFYDGTKRMWIGTTKGIVYYDGLSIRKVVLSDVFDKLCIWDVTADNHNKVWLATDQGVCFIRHDTVFPVDTSEYGNQYYQISNVYNTGLIFTSQEKLVLLKDNSLIPFNINLPKNAFVENVYWKTINQFYVCTSIGLYEYRINNRDTLLVGITHKNQYIKSFIIDNDGRKWLGTHGEGIYIIDVDGTENHINAYNGIDSYSISKLFIDSNGFIWVGTNGSGAYLFKGFGFSKMKFAKLRNPLMIRALTITGNNELWIGTDNNGVISVKNNNQFYFNKNNGLVTNTTSCIALDSFGTAYIGSFNGISVIKDNKVKRFNKKLVSNSIEKIFIDDKNTMWIGTFGSGLQCFPGGKVYNTDNGLTSNYVWAIYENTKHNIYVATDSGCVVFKNNKIIDTVLNSKSNTYIENVIEDNYGNMWFVGNSSLIWYNKGETKVHELKDFANCNVIFSVIVDKFGRLVLGTENGLVFLIINKQGDILSVRKVSRNNGFIGYECNFSAVCNDNKGNIYWGTIMGVIKHIPKKTWFRGEGLQMNIDEVDIFENSKFKVNYYDSIEPWTTLPVNLKLPHDRNNISISFSTPEFFYKHSINYQFKLLGLNNDWLEPTKQHQVSYNNLSPGRYTFMVRAFNESLPYKFSNVAEFSFVVKKPIYSMWWFRILVFILLVSVFVIIWNVRVNALRKRKLVLQKLVKERTRQIMSQKEDLEYANSRIKKNAKLQEQFLANTSHEMRTPLNVVIGYSNLLLNSQLQENQLKFVENIKSSGEHLKVIINDLLDLSKIQADKLDISPISFNYSRVITNSFNLYKIEAENKGIECKLISTFSNKNIYGDPVRLTQIISNLMRNAIKFTEKGSITLKVAEEILSDSKVLVVIEITDTGIGIPKSKTNLIFKSFTQLSGDLSRKYGGAGLGLSIVQKLVKLQNGTLKLDSEVGVGSKFTVELPYKISLSGEQIEKEEYIIENDSQLDNLSILVVDDNEVNISLAIDTLLKFNHTIKTEVAHNGKEALDVLEKHDFDLIIMDIQMPEMNGYTATKKIRGLNSSKSDIPILGMTAHAMKDERDKCLELGMDEYLSKPFSPRDLLSKIKHILEKHSTNGEKPVNFEFKTLQLDKLREIVGDSDKMMVKYLNMLINNVPGLISKVGNGLTSGNMEMVKVSAHSLKSTFRYYGADVLSKKCLKLEQYADGMDIQNPSQLFSEVLNEWRDMDNEVRNYLNN